MKFTPGPWEVDSSHVKTAVNVGNTHVAMVNWGINEEEHNANAHLIAAAPDMYEELTKVCNACNLDFLVPELCQGCGTKEALAKARGEKK